MILQKLSQKKLKILPKKGASNFRGMAPSCLLRASPLLSSLIRI
jgi:hypothetical protein